MLLFFFFQAEDGIRDVAVTGVQTCALPIYIGCHNRMWVGTRAGHSVVTADVTLSRHRTSPERHGSKRRARDRGMQVLAVAERALGREKSTAPLRRLIAATR